MKKILRRGNLQLSKICITYSNHNFGFSALFKRKPKIEGSLKNNVLYSFITLLFSWRLLQKLILFTKQIIDCCLNIVHILKKIHLGHFSKTGFRWRTFMPIYISSTKVIGTKYSIDWKGATFTSNLRE